jgi:hypothetical protein
MLFDHYPLRFSHCDDDVSAIVMEERPSRGLFKLLTLDPTLTPWSVEPLPEVVLSGRSVRRAAALDLSRGHLQPES